MFLTRSGAVHAMFCAGRAERMSLASQHESSTVCIWTLQVFRSCCATLMGRCAQSGLTYTADGAISKTFHVRDGHRLVLARRMGLWAGLVTGRADACVQARAKDLRLDPVFEESATKSLR